MLADPCVPTHSCIVLSGQNVIAQLMLGVVHSLLVLQPWNTTLWYSRTWMIHLSVLRVLLRSWTDMNSCTPAGDGCLAPMVSAKHAEACLNQLHLVSARESMQANGYSTT